MDSDRIKTAYNGQMSHSKERGIEFLFSLEEWVKWWEDRLGPDWFSRRGKTKGKFCMARKHDDGPYAEWNVMCITMEQNGHDRIRNGTSSRGPKHRSRAKLTKEQIVEIFKSKGSHVMVAKRFGISASNVSSIRNRKTWFDVTRDL